jgi:hypothetical protein
VLELFDAEQPSQIELLDLRGEGSTRI